MKGLLYKNATVIMHRIRLLMGISMIFLMYGVMPGKGSYGAVYASFLLSIFLSASLIRMDESSNWDSYCEILPLSRKTVISSYYVGAIIVIALLIVLYVILAGAVQAFTGKEVSVGITAVLMADIFFWMISFSIPLFLKFGSEKAAILQMIFTAITAMTAFFLLGNGELTVEVPVKINTLALLPASVAVTAILVILSWAASVKIYEHKEI